MTTRFVLRVVGATTLFSLVFWAFTGLPLWAPTHGPGDFREFVLFLLHFGGLVAFIFSFLVPESDE